MDLEVHSCRRIKRRWLRRKERSWIRRRRRRKEKRRRWLDISWVVSLPRDLRKVVARPIGPLLHPALHFCSSVFCWGRKWTTKEFRARIICAIFSCAPLIYRDAHIIYWALELQLKLWCSPWWRGGGAKARYVSITNWPQTRWPLSSLPPASPTVLAEQKVDNVCAALLLLFAHMFAQLLLFFFFFTSLPLGNLSLSWPLVSQQSEPEMDFLWLF